MKKLIVIALCLAMSACATPPRPEPDPNIPDNGMIILRIDNGQDYYDHYCPYPYNIGPYCDPYRYQGRGYIRDPQIEYYLRRSVDSG